MVRNLQGLLVDTVLRCDTLTGVTILDDDELTACSALEVSHFSEYAGAFARGNKKGGRKHSHDVPLVTASRGTTGRATTKRGSRNVVKSD